MSMKRIRLFLLLVGVVLVLSSCYVMLGWIMTDKMVLDGEDEYELAEMYLMYYGNPDGPHEFVLAIVSDGINWGDTVTGDGDVVVVGLASPDHDLADGTYEYSSSDILDDFDLSGGFVYIDANYSTMIADEVYYVSDGTVEVKQLFNDDYLVQMELELEDEYGSSGPDLELYFQGELADEYDYSSSSYSITAPLEKRDLSTW